MTVIPSVGVSGVTALSNPFRLKIVGAQFQAGCQVEIDGHAVPQTVLKSGTLVVAKGSGLKAMVPKGVAVSIVVANPDGSESPPFSFVR